MPTTPGETKGTGEHGRASARGGSDDVPRRAATGRASADPQLELLTAALIGVAVGVSAALLLSRGPRGVRPIAPVVRAAARGARWVRDRGEKVWDRVPHGELAEEVEDYARAAREAIDRVVRKELRTLRHTLRAQARRAAR